MHSPIVLQGVCKEFQLPIRKDGTFLSHITRGLIGATDAQQSRCISALRNISFSVQEGEVLGILGKNAAGKTTLLRIIAGIVHPSSGVVHRSGSITSLMNMGVGLRTNLTVRDNIYLACSCFGMSRRHARESYEDILQFGELHRYVDMYPYQLSAGMNQRLAFSIAIHARPEILLLDEVFSAGDVHFAAKALARMEQVIRESTAVVMVSHNVDILERLSDRILWLDDGNIRALGNPATVIEKYLAESDAAIIDAKVQEVHCTSASVVA